MELSSIERTFRSVNQAIERRHMNTQAPITLISFLLLCINTSTLSAFVKEYMVRYQQRTNPLTELAFEGNYLRLKAIIESIPAQHRQTTIDQVDKNGITPLMLGAISKKNSQDMVKLLLDYNADVNQQDPRGYTAPMLAIIVNNTAVIADLLTNYNLHIEDHQGRTLADHALLDPLPETARLTVIKEILQHLL
jgi:ankyrin repeat protein